MLASVAQTVKQAYEGPFSLGVLTVAGVILVLAIGLLMWRENRVARSWVMPPLFILRVAAVAVVLWMLAGPVTRTITAHTKPKSIGVLVDTSGSMSVVDPMEEDNGAVRWAAVHESEGRAGLLTEMDGAAIALASARTHFHRFAEVCEGKGRAEAGRTLISRALQSADAAKQHLEEVLAGLKNGFGITNDRLTQANATLAADLLPRMQSLNKDMQSDRLLLAPDRAERIERTGDLLGAESNRLRHLADGLATWYAKRGDNATTTRMQAMSASTRLEKTAALLELAQESWLDELEPQVRVMRYCFDESVSPMADLDWGKTLAAASGSAAATDLAAAMEQAARDSVVETLEALVLFTDGQDNTGGDPLKKATAMSGVPAYIIPVGNIKPLRDVMLHHVQAPQAVLKDDLIVIEAMVDAHGCAGEDVVVDLIRDDKVVDSEEVAVTSESFIRRVTFAHKADKMGLQAFRLEVHPVPDERIADNNEARLSVEVTEDRITVLLADHLPRWEHRYLRNLFKRAEAVHYDELLFEPVSGEERRPRFPQDLDGWGQYRVVILGDVQPTDLTADQQKMLEQYVAKRGGTLVLIAGKDAMPSSYIGEELDKLLPVQPADQPPPDRERGYSLLVTAEGRAEPMTQLADDPEASDRFWREQFSSRFPIYDLSAYSQPKPASHVLIRAVPIAGAGEDLERALLCWHKYGRGRVVYLAAPVMYRLRYRHGDRPHQLFWEQLLRWAIAREVAAGSQTVRLAADKMRYGKGDQVRVMVRLSRLGGDEVREANCQVIARQEDKVLATEEMEEDEDVPGTYSAFLKDLPQGAITITTAGDQIDDLLASEEWVEPIETTVIMEPPDLLEMRNTRCNLPLLEQIAESTGGLVIPPTGLATAIAQLDLEPEVIEEVEQVPLWNRWVCLLVFLGCLTAEWVVRKLTGLA